jgi:ABC-type Fe3+ transport system permease subunit
MSLVLASLLIACTVGALVTIALFLYHFFCMLQRTRPRAEWWINLLPFVAFALPGALDAVGQEHRAKAARWGAICAAFALTAVVVRYSLEG